MQRYTLLARESTEETKKVWLTTKKARPSRRVQVGEDITLYYAYEDDDGNEWTEKHHAVITKVNTKTFNAVCEGET